MRRSSFFLPLCVVCASACGEGRAERVAVESSECYALVYDPDDADPTMFPTGLMLRPGPDSGTVSPRAGDPGFFWQMFGSGATWRRLPSDSIRIDFTNELSALSIVVAHDGEEIDGASAFYFEKGKEAHPVMRVEGSRVDCAG